MWRCAPWHTRPHPRRSLHVLPDCALLAAPAYPGSRRWAIAVAAVSLIALAPPPIAAQTNNELITVDPSPTATVMEDDGAELTLNLSYQGSGAFIAVNTIDGTAENGSDYENASLSHTNPYGWLDMTSSGASKTTIKVPINWDYEVEGNENFQVHLEVQHADSGVNARFPGNKSELTIDVTITEREKYEVSLDPGGTLTEGESGHNNVRTERTGQGTVQARIGVADSTAGAADFDKWAPFNLRLNAFDPYAAIRRIRVETKEDTLVEATETIILELSNPTGNLTFPDLDGDGEPDDAIYSIWFITDNETPLFAEIPDISVAEGGEAQITFTLERELLAGESAEFYVNVAGHQFGSQKPCGFGADDYAQPNIDYQTYEYTEYVLRGGDQNFIFSVPTASDPMHEADECFYIRTFATSGLQFRTQTGQPIQGGNRVLFTRVTIEDDDPKPHFIFGSPEVVEPDPHRYGGDDPTAMLRFPVSLSNPSGVEVTVDYKEGSGGDATRAVDYTAISPGTLTFMPGEVRWYVDVEVKADWLEEPDERVYLEFSDAVEACLVPGDDCQPQSGSVTATGTILNNDRNLKITLTPDDDRVREGEAITFRARLSHPIDYEVRIASEWGGGTATEGDDYFLDIFSHAPELRIFPGTTEAILTIATLDDNVTGEGVESVTLPNLHVQLFRKDGRLQETEDVCEEVFGVPCASTYVPHGIPTPTAYILDGPVLNVTAEREDVAEGNSAKFTVALSEPVAQNVTFTIKSQDGGGEAAGSGVAVAGDDYTALSPVQVTIPIGQTDGGTYPVTVHQDQVDEPDQAFTVLLESVTGAAVDIGTAVVTVRDDDPRPTLSIGDAQAKEGDALEFVLILSQASERTIVVNYVTEDDTATGGPDYQAIERFESVTFVPGELSKTITVHSVMDNEPEIDETFRVQLVDDPGARFTDATAEGTITDDDGVVVSIADAEPVTETEGATPSATFTITLTPAQATPVTVQWQTMDGLGGEYDVARGGGLTISGEKDYTAVSSGSVTFAPGETVKQVSTTVLDDKENEIDENFRAVISVSDPSIMVLRSTAFATIEDDDAWNIWLDENNAAWVEEGTGETPKRLTVKVQRTNASAEESPLEARYHTHYSFITCFISEVGTQYPLARIPNLHDYISTAKVTSGGNWDVRRWHSNPTILRHPQCHLRGDASSFNVDKFEKLVYTLPLEFEIRGDSRPEENETFTLLLDSLFGPHGRRIDPVSWQFKYVTITIVDDDTPQASVSDVSVGEDVGNADVTVSLSMASSQHQKLLVSMEPGTAQPWEDYQPLLSHDVTFEPGETTKTVSIPIVNDAMREEDETFTVMLSGESAGINIHPGGETATVTIQDDESDYLPWLTVPDRVIDEGDAATLLFRLNPPVPNRFWVGRIQWSDDDKPMSLPVAAEIDDYAEITGNTADAVRVGLEQTEFTKTISSVEDTLIEAGEYIGISTTWMNAVGNHIRYAKPNALVAIRDDDHGSVAVASIAAATVEENEEWAHDADLTGASNPLGDVSWSVDGDDAAFFTIDQDSGVLTMSARNFEDPLDDDGDNVYEVTVHAVDEDGNADSEDVRVTVTDVTYATFTVQPDFCCHADLSKQVYGAEEGDGIRVSVYPRFDTSTPVSLKWATAEDTKGGNPAAATDYTPSTTPTKLSWRAGGTGTTGTSQTFTIATTEDALVEPNETFLLRFTEGMAGETDDVAFTFASALDGAVRTDRNEADATLTIGNDDEPELTVGDASIAEGGTAEFTVTLSAVSGRDVTVQWTTGDDPAEGAAQATADSDYTAVTTARTATIAAGSTTATIKVETTEDVIDEPDETFVVALASPTNATLGSPSTGTGTITDDDDAATTATLGVSPASVGEGAGATTVTVTATLGGTTTFATDKTVSVTVGRDGDAAVSGTDYTKVDAFEITIAAGRSSGSKTFTLTPTADALDEADETLTVHATAAGLTISDAGVAITDDDATPELTVGDASVAEGGTAEFTVTLSAVSGRDVTVQWTTGDDPAEGAAQATADSDYTAVTTARTATIAAGSTTATIEVETTEDVIDEPDETFVVALASPTNATLGSPSTGTGTITDDDDAATTATLGVSPASVGEGAGATTVTVTATLGGTTTFATDKTVSVTVGRDGDAAVSGTDYTKVDAFEITIAAGRSSGSKTFTLTPTADALDEADETLTVHATAAGLTISDAGVAITDDDATPELTVGDASVAEGGTAEFTVTLSAVSGRDVTVQWTTGDDPAEGAAQATADSDYTAVTTARTATIAAGDTTAKVEVQTTEDAIDEPDETFVVTLASPTNATLGTSSVGTGTITDDDAAPTEGKPQVTPVEEPADPEQPLSVAENVETAPTFTYTVTLTGTAFAEDKKVTVTVGTEADAAVSGTDYTKVDSFDLTIKAGELSGSGQFTLDPIDDTLDEDDETVTLTAELEGVAVDAATLTITDDDATPELTVGDASIAEGGTAEFTVTLSAVSGRDVTVQWTTGDDPAEGAAQATADSDYTAVTTARTATIAAGSTTATIEVETTEDVIDEPDETFVVALASPTNATLGSPSTGTGTITDDDDAATTATLGVSPASVGEGAGATTVTVTATLGGTTTFATDKTVSVTVGRDGDAAVSGTDYTKVDAFEITIAAGRSSGSKTFTLTPTADALDEADETLTVHATAAGLTISDAGVAITDDDATPELTVGDASVAEGGTAEFTVTLSAVSGRDVTVQWTTGDDPAEGAAQATADSDYTAVTTARTATIAAGDTTAKVEVQTTEDAIDEPDETFVVTLASPTNATLGTSSVGTGTITDDDAAPTEGKPQVTPVEEPADPEQPLSVAENVETAPTFTYTVTLTGTAFAEDKKVTVTVGTEADAAVSGTDYTKVDSFDLTIKAGELSGSGQFTLDPIDDTLDEDDETVTLTAELEGVAVDAATLTITDDDATPELTVGDASIAEGGTAEFTVTLSAVSGRDVTVQWTTGDDPAEGAAQATADSDYTAVTTARTATIAAGSTTATIEVETTEDVIDEPDETFVVALASPTNATLGSPSTGTGTITDDDDAATTATLGVSPASVGEGAGATTVTVTATLGGTTTFATDKTVSVTVGRDGDAAVSGTDYTKVDAFEITIAAGRSSGSKTFTLTPTADALDEADETLTVHATAAGLTISDAGVAITDDDATPELTVGDASVAEGGTAEFTVTLSAVSGRDVTVQWTTGDDPAEGAAQATADSDYTAVTTARTATIAAGSTTATIEVETTEDVIDEPDETFVVALASPTNATLGSPSTGTGTITDDDDAATTATLGVSPASVGEGAGATTVTVTATLGGTTTFATDKTVSVTVGRDGDAAVSGTDYTKVDAFEITIAAGRSSGSKTFTLTPTADALDEADETLTVHATAAGLTISDAGVAITDDDATPELTVGDASVAEGGTAEFTVTLSAVSGRDVTVQWTTGDDPAEGAAQATADSDYTAVTTARTATIAAGSTTATIEVETTEDVIDEPDETFVVALASPTNATLGSPSTGTGTITDDDDAATTATLGVSPASVGEGAGATTVTVTATLGGTTTFATDKTVSVTVGRDGDAAVSGTDYTKVDAFEITIAAGRSSGSKTFTLTPTADALDEADETLTVHATAAGLTISDAGVAITDDDATPELTVGDASVAEGGTAEFTVTLSAVSGRDVTVQWTTGDDPAEGAAQATADSDYTAVTTARTATIAAGSTTATIEVETTEDVIDEPDETFVVALASPTNATLGSPSTGTGTITDDDDAATTATLGVSPASVGEGAGATTVTVTATLGGTTTFATDKTVSVTVGRDGDAAVSGTDYTKVDAFEITIAAGRSSGSKTFTLTPTADALDEADETLTVHATAAGLTISDAGVAITDDDATPELTVGDASVAEGGTAEFTVTLSAVSGRDVTVQWTTGDDPAEGAAQATADSDYTAVTTARTATIAAGSTTATIEVETTEDVIDEPDETFVVALASPTNATLGSPSTGTGTITDDDDAATTATLGVSPASVGEGAGATTVTVTATLGGTTTFATDKTVSVTVGRDGDAAVSGTDYTKVDAFEITIAAGRSSGSKTFTLTPTADALDEADETLTVHATAAGLTISDAGVAITDDDATTLPALWVGEGAVGEGGKVYFIIELSAVSTQAVTVEWRTADDTSVGAHQAIAGTDYTAVTPARTVTIAAGATRVMVTVQTIQDSLVEGKETFRVMLQNPTNATLGDAVGTGTILDDDEPPLPAVSVGDATVAEGGTAQFTITLSAVSTQAVMVEWRTADDTSTGAHRAIAGTDYTAVTSARTATIAAGAASVTVEVQTTQDSLDEENETFLVTLQNPAKATLGDATGTATITDDDASPQVSVSDAASVVEGNNPAVTTDMTFTVSLSRVTSKQVTVPFTLGGTAAEGSDYTAPASLAVTVPPMTTGANIVVAVTGDTVKEDDETIVVTLGTPTNATLSTAVGAGTGTGIIKDDEAEKQIDADVTLRLSPPIIPENGGSKGASYVTATLSEPLTEDVTLQLDATAVAPAGAGEFVLSQNRRLVIRAGATESAGIVTVTAVDDDVVTSDKIIEISAVVVHPARLQAPDSAELKIIDDDLPVTPLATVGYERSAYTLGEDGRIDIGVVMSAAQTSEVVVRYNLHAPSPILGGSSDVIAKGDGLAGADYAGELVFAAGETRRVLKLYGVDNDIVEADEEVTLGLWVHTGDVKAGAPATVTLTDDDRSHLFFARTTSAVEEGGQQSILVRMNKAHQDPVSVALGVGGTATAGADYTALPQSVTFSPGTENLYLIVDTLTDGITEGTETLEIMLGAVTGFGVQVIPSAGTHQVEIADSRGAPKPTRARLNVTPGAVDEDAGATNVMVSATLGGTTTFTEDKTVSVTVGRDGDAAVSGTDYVAVNGFTITIPAGQASGQQSFMLTPTDDAAAEQHEALTVHGTAAGLSVADATVTITDDDGTAPTAARLIVNPAAVAEGAGATQVNVTATLVGSGTLPQSTTVSVNVGSQGDGAVSGTDYAAVSGFTITIPAGQASGQHTFTLTPTDDAADEPNEALTVHGTAAGLSVADATVTITDNDSDPQASVTVRFAQAAYTLNEDARLRIDVVMSAVQTSEVVVRYTLHAASTTLGGSADVRVLGDRRAGAGYDGEVVFAAGEARRVLHLSSVDNDIVEPDEEVTISLAAHTGNVSVGTSTTVTLTDDDSAHLFFIKAGSSVEEGGQQSIRVHMSKPHQDPVSVALSIGGTATADADYAALARSVTLSPGTENLYLAVSALTDGVTEGTETLDITLGAITGVGVTLDHDRIRHQLEITDGVGQLGQRQDAQSCASYLPSDAVTVAEVKTWRYENYDREHIERWNRVLAALGVYTGRTAMTAVEAAEIQARFNNSRWDRAARTLQALEDCANGVDNPPPPTPEISIAADGDITEGGVATFTISANPSPAEAITLSVSVAQSGDFGVTTGTRTVTIGTDGAGSLSVATTDDATDEPDGSVTVAVDSGTGYTVSAVAGVATAAVVDDDDPPPPLECTPELPSDAVTVTEVETWRDEYTHDEHVSRWNRVLAALGEDTGEEPMTAQEARDIKSRIDNSRWDRTVRTLDALEQCAGSTGAT